MHTKHISFYAKILLTIVIFFILPLSGLFLYSYSRMERTITQKAELLTQMELQQIDADVQDLFARLNRTATNLSTDYRLNDLMRTYAAQVSPEARASFSNSRPESIAPYSYLLLATEVQSILQNYAINWLDASSQIGIIMEDGHIFSTWSSCNTDASALEQLLAPLSPGTQNSFLSAPHASFIHFSEYETYFTYVKQLYDIQSPQKTLCTLVITTPCAVLQKIAQQSALSSAVYFFDQDRTLILREPGADRTGSALSESEMLSFYDQQLNGTTVKNAAGTAVFFNCTEIPGTGWLLCCTLPYSQVFSEIVQLRQTVATGFVFLLLLISLISFLIIYRLLQPIRILQKGMTEAENGDLDMSPLPCTSHDEVGMITIGFNRLIEKLRGLLSQVQEAEKQKGELRFEMLLAQINPHFLFNTLNSIRWMATMIHADAITNTIRSLARLLEISMNKQTDTLSIHDELLNLQSYLDIQETRYRDLFTADFSVPAELEQYETLKLVFQPIVENCILHNISDIPDLHILVQGRLEQREIVFTISDNGKGMTQQQIHDLFSEKQPDHNSVFRGIGIMNVQQRIQLKYGAQYGISMQSEPGSGTCTTIRFPAIMFCPPAPPQELADAAHES